MPEAELIEHPEVSGILPEFRHIAADPHYYVRLLHLFGLTLQDLAGQWICDYGCGQLRGVAGIAMNAARRWAVDRHCPTWSAGTALPILRDASAIPTDACDLVFCWDVLEHTSKRLALMADITRITRAGGHLLMLFHVHATSKRGLYHVRGIFTPDQLWQLIGLHEHPVAPFAGYWTVTSQAKDTDPESYERRIRVILTRTAKEYAPPCTTSASPTARAR